MSYARFAVIDDYGDDWQDGPIAYEGDSLEECTEWAESENYHSASIVSLDAEGNRRRVL